LPVEHLTSQDQRWIATAFVSLHRIWQNREASAPGDNAWCLFEVGDIYVQFLAPWNAQLLVCEAVSAKFVPDIANLLTKQTNATLHRLGFARPQTSPNYSQTIIVEGIEDLADAARLAFYVLREVYCVAQFGRATFKVKLPMSAPHLSRGNWVS